MGILGGMILFAVFSGCAVGALGASACGSGVVCGFVAEFGGARYGPAGAYAGAGPAGCGGAPCSR